MKAWNACYKGGTSPRHEIRVAMTPEEWKVVVERVYNWSEDLNETIIANFLKTMKNIGVEP